MKKSTIWILLSIAFGAFIAALLGSNNETNTYKPPYQEPSIAPISTPTLDITPLPPLPGLDLDMPNITLPRSGKVVRSSNKRAIAPLTIESATGSNYFLKLVDISSQTTVMTVFVQGGLPVKVKVPLGSYEIRYASGSKWYGEQKLFGAETSYSKALTVFDFKKEGNRIMGYTLKLYKVANGNLSTDPINQNQF